VKVLHGPENRVVAEPFSPPRSFIIRPNRFTRLVAAGALVASTLAVVGIAPAQAGPGPIATVDSLPNGTATITYSDFTQIEVYMIDGTGGPVCEDTGSAPVAGILGTLGAVSPMAASPVTIDTSTLVGPAPEKRWEPGISTSASMTSPTVVPPTH
jgi:hypothetical protein